MDNVQLWSLDFKKYLAKNHLQLFNLFAHRIIYVPDINGKINMYFSTYDKSYVESEHNNAMQKVIDDYLLEHPI